MSTLPITVIEQEQVIDKKEQMALYGGISVRIIESSPEKVVVRVEQMNLRLGVILNKKELAAKARMVIEPILGKVKVYYLPVVFKPKLGGLDLFWLKSKMEKYQLKIQDLVSRMYIDEETISDILLGTKPLTKFLRSSFFYFFYTLDVNSKIKEVG